MLKCARYQFARYCSPQCQAQHWLEHRHSCRALLASWEPAFRRGRKQAFYGVLQQADWDVMVAELAEISADRAAREQAAISASVAPEFFEWYEQTFKGKGKKGKGKGKGMYKGK